MKLFDVNVLVHAYREDAPRHAEFRAAFTEMTVDSSDAFGMATLVLSGFLRVVTHPRAFTTPAPLVSAIDFVDGILAAPNCVPIAPGNRHWEIFRTLCQRVEARGNLIADAYLAALAIESGSEWITSDRDFARFPGLTWKHPLDG